MIEIKYNCSNGKEYSLVGDRMRATSGYFHEYEWKPNEADMRIGSDVYGFDKEPVTYKLTLTLRGDLAEQKKLLNELTNCFEYDIANNTPGKIIFGTYYIECYIKQMSNKVNSDRNNRTDCEIEIYCPYPMWAEEQTKSFYKDSANKGETYGYLDYPFDYTFDYSKQSSGIEHWTINHYRSNNFKMIIYGACVNPRIVINRQVYQIFDTLEVNEYITVDSRMKTIYKHLVNGTEQNIFYKKGTKSSVFAEIPSGDLLVSWSGAFGFDITVYKERSVPEWN